MTSCEPRSKKVAILEKMSKIAATIKGKGPVVPDDIDTPTDDELSSGSSPSLNLSLAKNTRESTRTRLRKRPSPHPAFSDAISGASRRARREAGRRQYGPGQAPGNPPVLPSSMLPPVLPAHPAFGTAPTFPVPSAALIRKPDDMLSSPLWQHILDYEPPRGFVILAFTTFDGLADPYDHMLHYNQAITLYAIPGQFAWAGVGLVLQALVLLNKSVLRTMGCIHITISLLGATKEKHQLLTNHSQTRKRVDS